MNYFQYPLQTKDLLRKKKAIKRKLLEQELDWIEKKVAVLGGSTTNEVVEQLELFLLHYGIKATFYQSEYGQYWQDAIFGNEALDVFYPDIVYVHTNWRNIQVFPTLTESREEAERVLDKEYARFTDMWKAINERYHCPVIQNNFERPNYRLMGNRDIWDYRGRTNFVSRLNQKFYQYAQEHTDFYINDLEYLSANYGLSAWSNSLYWHLYKYAMCIEAIPYLAQSIANIIKSVYGKNKKVVALDLDNTLWGGVIGDDGVEGIAIGPEVARGQVFSEFQGYCKDLSKIGVILTVDSKNDMENALAGLNHPNGVLRPEDFVAIKANWNPKDQNLREMANELSLGVDSFVFVDDNPAEREIVAAQLSGVEVPIMDRPENYIQVLDHGGFFETTSLSQEDMNKTQLYHSKAEAAKAEATFASYNEYLESLEMTAYIEDFKPISIQRVAQLTNKTNQFNLTTLRCSEDDIRTMQGNPNYICLCGRLVDKFTDNGIVTVVAGEQIGKELHIRLWLMSCRVLKRGMEDVMMNVLFDEARKRGIEKVVGYYYPTAKNSMVSDFYKRRQFESQSKTVDSGYLWWMNVGKYQKVNLHINVVINI